MFFVETKVKLPFLWGKTAFKKDRWNQINLIVGPNGSGKTLLAEELAKQFSERGYSVLFLRAERIEHDECLVRIKRDDGIRAKIEFVLSTMFGKSIRFEETDSGTLAPTVINKMRGVEYGLKNGECHGLKEILTLLVALYADEMDCLILDEPELHLHPQFQLFFMKEIRKTAMEHPNRLFFLITHSPFFIDLQQPQDLLGVVVCHINRRPTHIDSLSEDDEALFRRFLPRFNTYHKQFFFSDNQIFVEGYTDQQMFTYLLECVEPNCGAAGTGIIDVGGKDELGVFFKVCSLLGTNAWIITDLDSLFCGKLREMLCEDERVLQWIEKQDEKQRTFYEDIFSRKELAAPVTLAKLIAKLERLLVPIGKCAAETDFADNGDGEAALFCEKLCALYEKYDNAESLDTFKTVVLQGIARLGDTLQAALPKEIAHTVPLAANLACYILAAAEAAHVYILSGGCIENYYVQEENPFMPIQGKDRLFHTELEYLMTLTRAERSAEYPGLIAVLNRAMRAEESGGR